jgi:hypothetical protein
VTDHPALEIQADVMRLIGDSPRDDVVALAGRVVELAGLVAGLAMAIGHVPAHNHGVCSGRNAVSDCTRPDHQHD